MDALSECTPRPAFVFYDSFYDAILKGNPRSQNRCLRNLVECALGRKSVSDVPAADRPLIYQVLINVEHAERRHQAAVLRGEKGGRPKKQVDLDEAMRLHEEHGSWAEVEKRTGCSEKTIYRARKEAGLI